MKLLPGVGVFGTGSSARVLVPLLRAEGFTVEALWGKTEEEAKQLAEEMNITFYTSRTDDVLLHQDVDLVCINIPPPLTRQISVKALGMHLQATVADCVSSSGQSSTVPGPLLGLAIPSLSAPAGSGALGYRWGRGGEGHAGDSKSSNPLCSLFTTNPRGRSSAHQGARDGCPPSLSSLLWGGQHFPGPPGPQM